jgi:hypothetical protein
LNDASVQPAHVTLLDEIDGPNSWHVGASLDAAGNLVIDGHDLGPATAVVSGDGEYEWSVTVRAASVDHAAKVLGGRAGESILEALVRDYSGRRAYGVRRTLDAAGVPVELWTWSG